jgi:Tol biopolymer transport system component
MKHPAIVFALTSSVSLLASCSSKTDAATGAGAGAFGGHLYWVSSAANEIHKVDLAAGTDATLGFGNTVSIAPDGKLVIIGRTGIEESDESLVSTKSIKKDDSNSFDYADHNFSYATVSPDGTKIAYNGANQGAYVIDRASAKVVARFESKANASDGWLNPSWTPDGRLVVAGGFHNPGLYVSDAGLTTMTRFDPDLEQPQDPAVSPDGTKVAFILKNLVFTIGIDGTGLTQIDPGGVDPSDEDKYPAWSPDGSHIMYQAYAGTMKSRPATGGPAADLFATFPALGDKLGVMSSTVAMLWTN